MDRGRHRDVARRLARPLLFWNGLRPADNELANLLDAIGREQRRKRQQAKRERDVVPLAET